MANDKVSKLLPVTAQDNFGTCYNVSIEFSDEEGEPEQLLKIHGTGCTWRLEDALKMPRSWMYIDLSQGWRIVNFDEVQDAARGAL